MDIAILPDMERFAENMRHLHEEFEDPPHVVKNLIVKKLKSQSDSLTIRLIKDANDIIEIIKPSR